MHADPASKKSRTDRQIASQLVCVVQQVGCGSICYSGIEVHHTSACIQIENLSNKSQQEVGFILFLCLLKLCVQHNYKWKTNYYSDTVVLSTQSSLVICSSLFR